MQQPALPRRTPKTTTTSGLFRPVLAVCLATALGSTAASQTAPQSGQPVFPSQVELVTVDVVVLDSQGNPVSGLTQADFAVKENGEPQNITAFEAVALEDGAVLEPASPRVSTNAAGVETPARWFFILFDDVHISPFATPRARDTLIQFADRVLRAGDRVLVASSSGGMWWTGIVPEDRESFAALVSRLQGARRPDTSPARIWDHEAMGIALGRDPQALAQVARRYFENNLIPEAYPTDREIRSAVDVSPGIGLIQVKARTIYREATDRLRISLATLERISASLTQTRGRKALLLFSEGFIMDPSQAEFRTLVRSARISNTAVHFVDVSDPGGLLGQPGLAGGGAEFGAAVEDRDATTALAFAAREADGARAVAFDTGGRVVSGSNLLDGLTRVAAETRSYYLLGYTPANNRRDGGFRRIEVTVDRPGVELRARGGYYAPSDAEPAAAPADKLDPVVRAGLDSPLGAPGIPLRMTSYVFGPDGTGKVQTLLLAEADIAPLRLVPRGGAYAAVLDSYALVVQRQTGGVERDERQVQLSIPQDQFERVAGTGIPVRREFALGPGPYQATLLLRDRNSGLIGSVRHRFDVPAENDFRTSTPVLTDSIQAAGQGQPPRPVPIARRVFLAGARLACAFDVYGAARDGASGLPRVTFATSLQRADGTEVVSGRAAPLKPGAADGLSALTLLTLPEGPPGEYALHLRVRDEVAGRSIEMVEPLTIRAR
jgi:VWFA-related protein